MRRIAHESPNRQCLRRISQAVAGPQLIVAAVIDGEEQPRGVHHRHVQNRVVGGELRADRFDLQVAGDIFRGVQPRAAACHADKEQPALKRDRIADRREAADGAVGECVQPTCSRGRTVAEPELHDIRDIGVGQREVDVVADRRQLFRIGTESAGNTVADQIGTGRRAIADEQFRAGLRSERGEEQPRASHHTFVGADNRLHADVRVEHQLDFVERAGVLVGFQQSRQVEVEHAVPVAKPTDGVVARVHDRGVGVLMSSDTAERDHALVVGERQQSQHVVARLAIADHSEPIPFFRQIAGQLLRVRRNRQREVHREWHAIVVEVAELDRPPRARIDQHITDAGEGAIRKLDDVVFAGQRHATRSAVHGVDRSGLTDDFRTERVRQRRTDQQIVVAIAVGIDAVRPRKRSELVAINSSRQTQHVDAAVVIEIRRCLIQDNLASQARHIPNDVDLPTVHAIDDAKSAPAVFLVHERERLTKGQVHALVVVEVAGRE